MITLDPTLDAHEAELLSAVLAEQLIEFTAQIVAAALAERLLLRVAHTYEQRAGWFRQYPPPNNRNDAVARI